MKCEKLSLKKDCGMGKISPCLGLGGTLVNIGRLKDESMMSKV